MSVVKTHKQKLIRSRRARSTCRDFVLIMDLEFLL
jgi:hypothetical protein